MSATITQQGQFAITARLNALAQALESPQEALKAAGDVGVAEAKRLARIKTGKMRDSTRADVTKDSLTIGSYVTYAIYNEMGTYRMSAQPFITPGMERAFDELVRIMNTQLSAAGR